MCCMKIMFHVSIIVCLCTDNIEIYNNYVMFFYSLISLAVNEWKHIQSLSTSVILRGELSSKLCTSKRFNSVRLKEEMHQQSGDEYFVLG